MWEEMGDEKPAKRAGAKKMEGKWRRERSKLRWGDCVKIDLEIVGEEWKIYR